MSNTNQQEEMTVWNPAKEIFEDEEEVTCGMKKDCDGEGLEPVEGHYGCDECREEDQKEYYKVCSAECPDVDYFDTLEEAKAFCDQHADLDYGLIMLCDSNKNDIGDWGDYYEKEQSCCKITKHTPEGMETECESCGPGIIEEDEIVTGWRVYDCNWVISDDCDDLGDDQNNFLEDFDTLEEAMKEFHKRCAEYTESDDVEAVYIEELGTDEDGDTYPIDTIEYWERMDMDEFKRLANIKKKCKKLSPCKLP
jgi:hypothetical protein